VAEQLLIFGTGTLAEIAAYYLAHDGGYEVCGHTDLPEFITPDTAARFHCPVIPWPDARQMFPPDRFAAFVAIGYRKTNTVRRQRFDEVLAAGYGLATYISPRAINHAEAVGVNCFILEQNVLQPFTRIGDNVTMWSGNHLGHHSIVEDNCFITSQVVISGKCRIGANSFLGVNACLRDGVTIGEKSVVGAGSLVMKDCAARSVFAPTPTESRIISRDLI
jgi:sugar O-acyltransferase (sialic acid O-acetyltransferase NeuD family)